MNAARGVWLGPPERPVAAWLNVARDGTSRAAVVICPPLSREQVTSYRTLRQLAERLSDEGLTGVRISWAGVGDGAPRAPHEDIVSAAVADLATTVAALRTAGFPAVYVLGVRVGALLAAAAAATARPDRLVSWDPVATGARHLRAERVLLLSSHITAPADGNAYGPGTCYSHEDQTALRALDLGALDPGVPTLLVKREGHPTPPGRYDEVMTSGEMEALFEAPSLLAAAPRTTIGDIARRLAATAPPAVPIAWDALGSTEATFTIQGRTVSERFATIAGHPSLVTEPLGDAHGTVAFLPGANEAMSGPTGLWAEASRLAAALGSRGVRFDRPGAGELGGPGAVDGTPYNEAAVAGVGRTAQALRDAYGGPLAGVGLCSGAYLLLSRPNAGLFTEIDAYSNIISHPSPARADALVSRAVDEDAVPKSADPNDQGRLHALVKAGMPYPAWAGLGRLGLVHAAGPMLAYAARRTRVNLPFAPGDVRIFREQRGPETVAGLSRRGLPISWETVPDLDHALLGAPGRRLALDRVRALVDRLREDGATPATGPTVPEAEPGTPAAETSEVPQSGAYRGVGRGIRWSATGAIFLRMAQFLIGIVAARLIAPSQFGAFALALTVYGIVLTLSDLGVTQAIVREVDRTKAIGPTVMTLNLGATLLLSGSMALLAGPLAGAFSAPDAVPAIRVLALTMVFGALGSVPAAVLARDYRQQQRFLADATNFVVSSLVLMVLALLGQGVMALAYSRLVGQVASAIVLNLVVGERYPFGWDPEEARRLLAFSLPLAGAMALDVLVANVDTLTVSHRLGLEQLGYYNLAFTMASWPIGILGQILMNITMTTLARAAGDVAVLRYHMRSFASGLAALAFPGAALLIALDEPLIVAIYGDAWRPAVGPLAALGLYVIVKATQVLLTDLLVALGRTGYLFRLQMLWLVALVPAMYLLVGRFGTVGAALANVGVGIVVVIPAYLWTATRASGIGLSWVKPELLIPLGAAVAAGIAARLLVGLGAIPMVTLLTGILVAAVVYLGVSGRWIRTRAKELRDVYTGS